MERFMLLCDSLCQNRNQNGNGHVNSDKKKGSSTASLKWGTFISSFLVIVPRVTEGEILNFVKRQTMGPAARTVTGEEVRINLREKSRTALFPWIG